MELKMFRDQITGQVSQPKEKGVKIVTKTRPKSYYGEKLNAETKKMETVLIAEGFEIVEEKLVLPETARGLENGKIEASQTKPTSTWRGSTIIRRD